MNGCVVCVRACAWYGGGGSDGRREQKRNDKDLPVGETNRKVHTSIARRNSKVPDGE